MIKKSLFLSSILLPLSLLVSSCNPTTGVKNEIDDGVEELNDALLKLDQQSNNWQEVLVETRDTLIAEGNSTLANEVSSLIRQTTSDIGVETRCTTDFFRDRAREELLKLRSTITRETINLIPVVCQPNPSSIDFEKGKPNIINITGYNLSQDSVNLYLQESVNSPKKPINYSLNYPTKYLMTIIVSKIENVENSHQLVLELGNGGGTQTIGIQQKAERFETRYVSSTVRITGSVTLNDDEIFKDEVRTVNVNDTVTITNNKNGTYNWNACVGDEVHGYLNSSMSLNPINGYISLQGTSDYYEGTKCGKTELQKDDSFNFTLQKPQQSEYSYARHLKDSEGGVRFNLKFKYLSAETEEVKVE